MLNGIDVSKYQGNIDWAKVKKSGIDFAIVRLGYTGTKSRRPTLDPKFKRNLKQCAKFGINVGVYYYSTATTIKQAQNEAKFVLKHLKGHKLQYPVYIDSEDAMQARLTKSALTSIIKEFCEAIENAGYYVGIYANKYWFATQLNDSALKAYDKWVAQYGDKCTYNGDFGMWQYTDRGKIDGIKGNVDLNKSKLDYAKIIKKAKLNGNK